MLRRLAHAVVVSSTLLAGLAFATTAEAQRPVPINIESTPPGATVYLDAPTGQVLGTTPLRNVRVPRGPHILIFRLDNHEEARLPVNVSRRRETFRVIMNAQSVINVTAGNEAATGAAVRFDGQPVGNVPYRGTVVPGRHLVQVGREGFVTFSQWVEVAGAQVANLPVSLERERPQTGSILVAADISGVPVFLDGQERGQTPTVIEDVTLGQHQLELRPPNLPVHRESVTIATAGQRVNINPTLRPAPAPTGTLRVLANAPGAVISIDGEAVGNAPVSQDLPPGEHIIEATAEGYDPIQQTVTITQGQSRAISLQLQRTQAPPGRIIVNANVGAARVIIDGEQQEGPPPIVRPNVAEGTHAVAVMADGYQDFRTTCEVRPGNDCVINAELRPVGVPVIVRTQEGIRGATLFVDGESMGPVPYEGQLPAGEHRFEIRADGWETHVEQVRLAMSSEPRTFEVSLVRIRTGLSEEELAALAEERARARFGATTHSATPMPIDFPVVDLSLGWPHLLEARGSIGLVSLGMIGIDAGVAIRTFGRLSEFEGRAKLGFRALRQLALAVQARFGGGLGVEHTERHAMGSPGYMEFAECEDERMMSEATCETTHSTNTWFFNLEFLSTLNFGDRGAFSLWLGFDSYTDRWDYDSADVNGNENFDELIGPGSDGEISRQGQGRIRLGGAIELVIDRRWNAWGMLEGIIVDAQDLGDDDDTARRLYSDIFGLGVDDTEFYFRLGFSYKF